MKHLVSSLLVLTLSSGCATVLKGSKSNAYVRSEPAGAKVYVDTEYVGNTPIEVKMQSKDTHKVVVKKEGHQDVVYNSNPSIGAGWLVLDILFLGMPILVDAITGAWYGHDDRTVGLEPKS